MLRYALKNSVISVMIFKLQFQLQLFWWKLEYVFKALLGQNSKVLKNSMT